MGFRGLDGVAACLGDLSCPKSDSFAMIKICAFTSAFTNGFLGKPNGAF